MTQRTWSLGLIALCLLALGGGAYASPDHPSVVPEASALVLAPMGIAAVVAAERRRRQYSGIRESVGALYYLVKRIVDVTVALTILTVSFPLFLAIAVLVRLDSAGPIMFRRRVVGRYGKQFNMYKFRSMVEGAEQILEQDEELKKQYYVNAKLQSDPRVTRLGRFLRKTSLDELPQLINVLFGNMTFVGPRPIAPDEIELYGPEFERFKTVTPGITGLWQTCGRSETSYEKRVQMDMLYIEQRSILLDAWIMVSTIPAVLLKRGAY